MTIDLEADVTVPHPRAHAQAHWSKLIDLPDGRGRPAAAVLELRSLFQEWSVTTWLAPKLLAGAGDALAADGRVEMFVELHHPIVTVELWCDEERIFGIDDWLGEG